MSKNERNARYAMTAGLLAMAVALAAGELVAWFTSDGSSPVLAVGSTVIDLTPTGLKDFAVRTFGTYDKVVLLGSILLVLLAIAAGLGLLAVRHLALAVGGVVGLAGVAGLAAATRPAADLPLDVLPSLVAAFAGAAVLTLLTPRKAKPGQASAPEPGPEMPTARSTAPGRRGLIVAGLGAAALAGTAATLRSTASTTSTLRLPLPASPARAVPAGADLRLPGLTPFVTPAGEFYRVDTALTIPRLDVADWTLRIRGTKLLTLTMSDILSRGLIERDITLTCVSNEVGGPYAGNARWLGAPLAALLLEAGIPAGADQLLSRSVDGWTASTPLEAIMDGRDAMLAVGMNGKPLPPVNGYPARLVVPGLYGFVSATKWVVELDLTTYAARRAYWTERGWATRAPIKTMSRIDLPAPLSTLRAGTVQVAGVAWAQGRGVARVEVRVDGGAWRQAQLAPVPTDDTWRQWSWPWPATPGTHRLEVRASDAAGHTQEPNRVPPFPDGASGWHSVVVTVR